MGTKTTTDIVLTHHHRTDEWIVSRRACVDVSVHKVAPTLDDCARAAGLRNGYWLRQHQQADRTTWTWVQL